MSVSFQEIRDAFEFVNIRGVGENLAFLCRQSGKIYCHSEFSNLDDNRRSQSQAAARFVNRRADAFLGAGMRRSAGTRNRARSRCTIAMLSPFLPRRTSLTRLGVPRIGTMSARVTPCWSIR